MSTLGQRNVRACGLRLALNHLWIAVALAGLLAGCTGASEGTSTASTPAPFDTSGRAAADWELAPGESLTSRTTSILVSVRWGACASAALVEDPRPVVTYEPGRVTLTVYGIVPNGHDFTCQGNPSSALEVRLSEPLGNRELVPGAEPVTSWPG